MVRRLIWSIEARNSRKNIFEFWNNHIKSKSYSNKLNTLFNDHLKTVVKFPELGNSTSKEDTKYVISSHFKILYKIAPNEIIVLDIWDTRQNPHKFRI